MQCSTQCQRVQVDINPARTGQIEGFDQLCMGLGPHDLVMEG